MIGYTAVETKPWMLEEAIIMWNEGKSAGQLALYYGLTKNAVIGRLHRARLKGNAVPMRKIVPKRKRQLKPMPIREEPIVEPGGAKPIYLLEAGECKYPTSMNKEGVHLFCGAPVEGNYVYCEKHRQVVIKMVIPPKVPYGKNP